MTEQTTDPLTSRWTALPNDEIGGWAVSADGRTPLDGGLMAADLVLTKEIAEHIADVHNRQLGAQRRSDRLTVQRDNHAAQADRFCAELVKTLLTAGNAIAQRDQARQQLRTMTEVARGNKRHVAVLAEVIDRVEKFAEEMGNYCSPHGVATRYADRLREVLHAPTNVEKAGRMPDLAGDRVEDGGVMGTLVRCENCGGDGLLHKPDHLPPTAEPQESPEPVPEPDGCPEPVWDGPYKMRCGLGASGGVCGRHGRFRFPYGDEKPSP